MLYTKKFLSIHFPNYEMAKKKNEFLKKVSLVINQFNDFATKFGKAKKKIPNFQKKS